MNIEKIYKKLGFDYFYSPYDESNWQMYPRQSGRTIRMLLNSIKRAIEGNDVFIIGYDYRSLKPYSDMIQKFLKKLKYDSYITTGGSLVVYRRKFFILKRKISYILFVSFYDYISDFQRGREMDYKNVFIDNAVDDLYLEGGEIRHYLMKGKK